MVRLVASVFAFLVMVAILCVPAALYGLDLKFWDEAEVDEPTTITSYRATFDVDENGDLDVVETLTLDVPVSDRHGIFRFFDREDPSQPDVRRRVEDVEVTADGNDVPVDHSIEESRYDAYRIGDPNTTLSIGEHVYVLRYHLPAVLAPGGGDVSTESQFYWNLIPSGWLQDIERSVLTVHLPAPAEDVQCAIGVDRIESDARSCKVRGVGTDTLTVRTKGLDAHTPVTLLAGQDVATPSQATLPWPARFDNVFGASESSFQWVAAGALLLGGAGLFLGFLTVERRPRFPLMYAPPDGIGPAQAQLILAERLDRRAYVASLMQAAEQGAVEFRRTKDANWMITDKAGPAGWADLDKVTSNVAGILGGPGSNFVINPESPKSGRVLQRRIEAHVQAAVGWGTSSGLLKRAGLGKLGRWLVIGGFVAVVVIAAWNPFRMSMVGLPVAALTAGAVPLLMPASVTKRTASGRELWSRVGGFKRVLSTPSSKDRFDFSGRKELYTAYLPYAVAIGCAKEWAEKYRVETGGAEPPTPTYFQGYGDNEGIGHGSHSVASMVGDFDSSLGTAISSYEATQRSSSGGDSGGSSSGGFSGGEGGGGGGGGSW